VEWHAIVLGSVALRETDKIVSLYTAEQGRVSAVAKGAARSQKRFAASLEPLSHVKAQLRVPRETGGTEAPLWRIDRADIQSHFAHLRASYGMLENASFVLRIIRDLVPEGNSDPCLFKALGRFLRDTEPLQADIHSAWPRVAFWTWFAHHVGLGDFSRELEESISTAHPHWLKVWHSALARPEPEFKALFTFMAENPLPPLGVDDEVRLYRHWVDISGIHWEHFEKWTLGR
jgi:hypothetical protein